ncbi:hypothetical protein GCM10007205_09300 [Oxalicibacterium flavum]|uniref:DUF1631 domain-containing protein n=1 Tax=Oxalicibacterium flavum TaxID=179467 RepID=A0A8J2ULL3_9BURK|nr:DUF1631 family protein [Oxalicibacterium flavum]GGC02184.1 hypothetical protein GCM10007205_09300 [Oxalicibacterium flavum]
MPVFHPVVLLASERARFRFSLLAVRILQDARDSVERQVSVAPAIAEPKTIAAVREYLATQADTFPARLTQKYSAWLDRGMQTMYRDLRALRMASMEAPTLMDDALATRQMEIERRVLRLREADQHSLERLNAMIAQLHGETDIRERENPFRPYLMARALHDVLCETTRTTDVCTMLFDHLSGALATRLPDYFGAVLAVFDAQGEPSRLMTVDGGVATAVLAEDEQEAQRIMAVIAATESVQQDADGVLPHIANALRERLSGMTTDTRVRDFIVRIWSRVLAYVALHRELDSQPFLAVVPDLLWSVQALEATERSRLMRLVPTLATRIREGLRLIDLPEPETKALMDMLVELHARALRPLPMDNAMPVLSMAELHRRFAPLSLSPASLEAPAIRVPTVSESRLRVLLKEQGADAALVFDDEPAFLHNADAAWLEVLHPGITVTCWRAGRACPAMLLATDEQRTFYLFRLLAPQGQPSLLLYSTIALIKGLREGSVSPAANVPR